MNHGDAAPLAAAGIVPASFLPLARSAYSKNKKLFHPIASSSPGFYALASLVALSLNLGFVGVGQFGPSPPSWPPSPPSKVDAPQVASLPTCPSLHCLMADCHARPRLLSLLLSIHSSQLSCHCHSSRLHQPSRYNLRGIPSQSH